MQTPETELLGYRQFLKKDEGRFMPAEFMPATLSLTCLILQILSLSWDPSSLLGFQKKPLPALTLHL